MRYLKPRGQVSAPIELFVAVIILAMSMALAFSVIRQSSENRCLSELKNNLRGLEAAMVDVAVGSPPTTREFYLAMPVCETTAVSAVRVVFYGDPRYCQACPGQFGGCWKLEPISKDNDGVFHPISDATVCVNIAGRILLVDEGTTSGGTPANPDCTTLSDSPCPPGFDKECTTQYSGIPAAVWDKDSTERQNATFQTVAKVGNVQSYKVRLRKSITESEGQPVGTINICVRPAYNP